ncbi:uncharacterized protein E0L32_007495 [Thyridium curvatum]|uniref:Infection structure specific protein n=1 Tax=Thyridium curvatum TaxID=1093900 RepID=A0A507B4G1_9PEZI|nr:uncharacterized protein E0L32_007495 [Thyridium curvatum]TPX11758.1 hypothetical protein E0L32_007495 [Thyridium curvatum]
MHSSAVLAILASAAAVSADMIHPGHLAVKRDVLARQTDNPSASQGAGGPDTACLTALVSVYSSIPTPPPELASYEAAHPPTDPCSYSVDDSIKPVFSSYESQVISWAKQHEGELSSALSKCPQYASLATEANICTTAIGGGAGGSGGSASAKTTDSSKTSSAGAGGSSSAAGGKSGSSSSSTGATPTGAAGSSSTSKAAAAQETGFVAAVIAAVGFVGAVAAL